MKRKWIFFCQPSQIPLGDTGAWRPVTGTRAGRVAGPSHEAHRGNVTSLACEQEPLLNCGQRIGLQDLTQQLQNLKKEECWFIFGPSVIWCHVACVSGGSWPWAEVVLIFRNVQLCLICCETSLSRIECLMADGETVEISPWALGHERVEGKCAAGNGIHAGKTRRMEGWASRFRLNTESSGSQIVPLAGPEIPNTNTFLCYCSL